MFTPDKSNVATIYCVGRNYAAHAKELNNPIPDEEPVIFTKARSTVCAIDGEIALPMSLGRCDHETEIVIRIGKELFNADKSQVIDAISHIGLGLDLTLREKQTQLKQQQYPWDLAKSFINACPLSSMVEFDSSIALDNIEFSLQINGETIQAVNTRYMLFDIITLVHFLSHKIPLMVGDLIMTGTPEGVGPLHHGDMLTLKMDNRLEVSTKIIRV